MTPTTKIAMCFVLGWLVSTAVTQTSYQGAKSANDTIAGKTTTRSITPTMVGDALNGVLDASTLLESAKTADFTAEAGYAYTVDTTLTAITVTGPSVATQGDRFAVTDLYGTWGTNNCTVDFGNWPLHDKVNPDNDYIGNGDYAHRVFVFDGTRWLIR